jgi:hypothetical protein
MALKHTLSTYAPSSLSGREIGPIGLLGRWAAPHRAARPLGGDALQGRRGGMGRNRGGSRSLCAARREGAVGSRLGGNRLGVRSGAPADRQELNGLGSSALTVLVHAPEKTASDPAFRRAL